MIKISEVIPEGERVYLVVESFVSSLVVLWFIVISVEYYLAYRGYIQPSYAVSLFDLCLQWFTAVCFMTVGTTYRKYNYALIKMMANRGSDDE